MYIFHADRERHRFYHWHRECRLVPADVGRQPDWRRSNLAPGDRDRCSACRGLDGRREQQPQPKQVPETIPISQAARKRKPPLR